MRKLLLPLLVLSLAFSAAFVACGDDDDDDKGEKATATATASPRATERAGGQQGGRAGNIADLKSFEYQMTITGLADLVGALGAAPGAGAPPSGEFKVKGAYKAPDRASFTMTIAGQELSSVVIGKDQWVKIGGTWLGPTPADGDAKDSVLAIAFWDKGFQTEGADIRCPDAKSEKVNGVDAQRCTLDTKDIRKLAEALGEDADFGELKDFKLDVWLAKDGGYPVRFEFTAVDSKTNKPIGLKFELTNINGDVKIEAPRT